MITHCPYCRTHFRVHPDQLAARAGQVRCGKCTRVFDALEYLIEEAGRSRQSPAASDAGDLRTADQGASRAVEGPPGTARSHTGEAAEIASETDVPVLAASPEPAVAAMEVGADMAPVPELLAIDDSTEARAPGGETAAFDFGPAAGEASGKSRRWPWVLGSLLLLLVLAVQAAYYYRSAIIVLVPEVKPYATTLCAKLGCDLPLPQRIELISIEASDLQADTTNPNIMVLSATLRNRAIFDQQLPSIELTLTNAQEQPVVRRVLAPQDYAGKSASKQAAFGANTEIAIKVFIEGSQVKATGYRLYLFYP